MAHLSNEIHLEISLIDHSETLPLRIDSGYRVRVIREGQALPGCQLLRPFPADEMVAFEVPRT